MDLDKLKKGYKNLVNDIGFDKLELILQQPNVFEIIGVVNKEIKHSNFLGWLCDPNGSHGLNEIFLKRFLREIFASKHNEDHDTLDAEVLDYNSVEIRREWRNIDLLILFPHKKREKSTVICIENKIWSKEHSNQLNRYRNIVEVEFNSDFKQQVFVYLNPYGYSPNEKESVYVPLAYSVIIEILNRIIQVFDERLNTHSQLLINDYIKILKRYMMQESEEITYAQMIYQQHKEVLDFIYENKPDLQQDLQKWISNYLENEGYVLGSKNKGFARFLPHNINSIIPRYKKKYGGWNKNESFLFEFVFFPGDENGILFQCAIAPGEDEIRKLLYECITPSNKSKELPVKNWISITLETEKVNWKKVEQEGVEAIENDFINLFKKATKHVEEISILVNNKENEFKKLEIV